MPRFTLSKEERLSSLKAISFLFESGQSLTSFPVRLVWKQLNEADPSFPPVQVMFSVPKKKFPRAVDRNRVRRLMRENFRMRKPDLFERVPANKRFHLAIIFAGNELPSHAAIQKGMNSALDRWLKKIITPLTNEKS